MNIDENNARCCRVDRQLLPIKFLFFVFDGGMHCMIAYRAIYYKHLGLSSYEVGLIILAECIFATVATPVIGIVSDKLKRPKAVIVTILIFASASVMSQYFIPYVPRTNSTNIAVGQPADGYHSVNISTSANISIPATTTASYKDDDEEWDSTFANTFWLALVLVLMSSVGIHSATSLIQSSVMTLLGDEQKKFGRQIMWGALGGGGFIAVVGVLKDFVKNYRGIEDRVMFLPLFICNNLFWLTAALVTSKLPLKLTTKKKFRFGDIKAVLLDMRSVAFFLVLWVYGLDLALCHNFVFWYAETKLDASGTVLGMSALCGTVAVLPVFLVAGRVIEKFGCDAILVFTMLTFALRFLLYTMVSEAWMVIPMELFRIISYAIAYTTICTYASMIAPEGAEATIMALVYAVIKTVGTATGAGVGGWVLDRYGGEFLFAAAAVISLVAGLAYALAIHCIDRGRRRRRSSSSAPEKPLRGNAEVEELRETRSEGADDDEMRVLRA